MVEELRSFYINNVPRQQNAHADALASLDASLALSVGATEKVLVHSRHLYCLKFALEESQTPEGELQVNEIFETSTGLKSGIGDSHSSTVLYGTLPNNHKEAAAIKRKAPRFYYNAITRTLYRRSHDGILFRCLSHKKAQKVLKEAHDGMCGAKQPGLKLGDQL